LFPVKTTIYLFTAQDQLLFDVSDLDDRSDVISSCGRVHVTLDYRPPRGRLYVTVHEARDLPSSERGSAEAGTRVHLALLPHKAVRHRTKSSLTKTGSGNQLYEETFQFPVMQGRIAGMSAQLEHDRNWKK
jgi:hypothetical protein